MQTQVGTLLATIIAEQCPDEDVALLLSGGVDSLSCGFAATTLGKRVHAYRFQVEEHSSEDSRSARDGLVQGLRNTP